MRLTIVNSTAPGSATLLSPFFDALADFPEIDLTVLEQVPASGRGNRVDHERKSMDTPVRYRLETLPTYLYHRRHASAQILGGRFRQALTEARPDITFVLGEPGYISTYQVARFADRHLPQTKFCLFAAQNVYQRFPPPFPWIERWVLARVDHAFPIGQDHADVLRKKGYAGQSTYLPLGVDTTLFAPQKDSARNASLGLPRPVVGYAGDFLAARDVALLIEAIAMCRTAPGLLIIGDGPRRPELEALSRTLGLADRVKFIGRLPHSQMPEYLNCLDMLVLPSKVVRNRCFGLFRIANAEQFGRVLVEAMACGKPVIGSSCGEIPHVIGEAGRVYPEGDRDALAAALDEFCADEALRQRLGQAGLARARTYYDWRVLARRVVTVFDRLSPSSVPEPIRSKASADLGYVSSRSWMTYAGNSSPTTDRFPNC